ncbi:hypothetical protein HQ50_03625 [Porphyromonas sp. COT-052 OH4946]|nr:hypothetical protein HQ50_03625 [Porphyromonas sp. COT-052 OH4946]
MGLCSNHRICAQSFSHTARWVWKERYGEVVKEEKSGIRSSSYFPLFENVKNDRAETCRQKDLSFIKLDGSGLKKRGAGKFFFWCGK